MRSRHYFGMISAILGMLVFQSNAEAAVVSINIKSAGSSAQDISGPNAGISFDEPSREILNFVGDATLFIFRRNTRISLDPNRGVSDRFQMATINGGDASIFRFEKNNSIDQSFSGVWHAGDDQVAFYNNNGPSGYHAPNFGPDSFIGFRFGDGADFRYGYIEVLWNWTGDRTTSTFEILSAAYEDQLNTPILAGAQSVCGGQVPEPTSMAIFSLGVLGMAYRARRKAKA